MARQRAVPGGPSPTGAPSDRTPSAGATSARTSTPRASATRVSTRRKPLTRERVLRTAIDMADEGGLEAVSMRKLGQALRVDAMAIYRHVADKDDLLDGIADLVTSEFEVPSGDVEWRAAIARSATSAHEVLLRHPWAGGLIESRRTAGPARLRYLDAVIGVLSAAGLTMPEVLRAIMVLDSYTYGFVLQEFAWPIDAESTPEAAATLAQGLPEGAYPHLLAMAETVATVPGVVRVDFAFGLGLVLDGLERLRGAGGG